MVIYSLSLSGELQRATPLSTGYDLKSISEDKHIKEHEIIVFDTGVFTACATVADIQARLRSGITKKGIFMLNGIGTIDADYRGSWKYPLSTIDTYGSSVSNCRYSKICGGDRIGQMILPTGAELSQVDLQDFKKFAQLKGAILSWLSDLEEGIYTQDLLTVHKFTDIIGTCWHDYVEQVIGISSERGTGGFGSSGT